MATTGGELIEIRLAVQHHAPGSLVGRRAGQAEGQRGCAVEVVGRGGGGAQACPVDRRDRVAATFRLGAGDRETGAGGCDLEVGRQIRNHLRPQAGQCVALVQVQEGDGVAAVDRVPDPGVVHALDQGVRGSGDRHRLWRIPVGGGEGQLRLVDLQLGAATDFRCVDPHCS